MSKQSKNQANAAKAVAKSEKKTGAERTTLEVIADIRHNLGSGLAVTSDDQRFLLTQYDDVHALMVQGTELTNLSTKTFSRVCDERDRLQAIVDVAATLDDARLAEIAKLNTKIAELTAKNEEFREVYEQENRRGSVTLEQGGASLPETAYEDCSVPAVAPGECGTLTETADAQ